MTELDAGIVGRDRVVLERFYTEVMGFTVASRTDFDAFGTVLRLRRDRARIKLFFPTEDLDPLRIDDPWFRAGGWRYAALNLDAADAVDQLAAACAAAGGRVLREPSEHRPGARMAVVADPEGNPWELIWDGAAADAERGAS
jgi:catechol 2,3-dioxygenase-like lactoylglutathione lyase family enzyme